MEEIHQPPLEALPLAPALGVEILIPLGIRITTTSIIPLPGLLAVRWLEDYPALIVHQQATHNYTTFISSIISEK